MMMMMMWSTENVCEKWWKLKISYLRMLQLQWEVGGMVSEMVPSCSSDKDLRVQENKILAMVMAMAMGRPVTMSPQHFSTSISMNPLVVSLVLWRNWMGGNEEEEEEKKVSYLAFTENKSMEWKRSFFWFLGTLQEKRKQKRNAPKAMLSLSLSLSVSQETESKKKEEGEREKVLNSWYQYVCLYICYMYVCLYKCYM